MPRMGRIVAVDMPHHITQRGNYQNAVFADDGDRQIYLKYIYKASKEANLRILAYCLMDNHVHFIAIPQEENSLAKTFNTAHMRYSQYFNKKRKVKGHLWQGRLFSCVLDETHLISAVRYIERNPVRAKMVKSPLDWKYSSAKAHTGGKEEFLCSVKELFNYIEFDEKKWKKYIIEKDEKEDKDNIVKHTASGRPLGSADFIARLENKLGKRLHALPWGRPVKK
jgi:putative transposase